MSKSKQKEKLLSIPKEDRRRWYTEDVADFLGISKRTVCEMVHQNEIPTSKIRGLRCFDRDEVLKWFKLQQTRVS